jgi:hypothetical protein
MPRLFLPTARQVNVLLLAGLLSLGYALYFRYLVIEQSTVGLACEAGLNTWLCLTRRIVIFLFNHSAFGIAALAAALVNLVRPSLLMSTIGLAAAALGVVLYNGGLSALAVPLIILSLARPEPAAGPPRE